MYIGNTCQNSPITLRIAHLRIAHWGAIPRWAILSPSVIRIAHPNYYVFLWIVCAWYGPWVNAGDTTSVFKHNILKNKVIYAIWWTIWKGTMEKSQTNSTNAMKIWKWRRSKVPKSKTLRLNFSSEIICWANMLESCAFICKRHEELVPQTCNLVRGAIIPRL